MIEFQFVDKKLARHGAAAARLAGRRDAALIACYRRALPSMKAREAVAAAAASAGVTPEAVRAALAAGLGKGGGRRG